MNFVLYKLFDIYLKVFNKKIKNLEIFKNTNLFFDLQNIRPLSLLALI